MMPFSQSECLLKNWKKWGPPLLAMSWLWLGTVLVAGDDCIAHSEILGQSSRQVRQQRTFCDDAPPNQAQTGRHFEIQIVDAETGRGVPLVELKTVNGISYISDSAGRIAFFEPGLMGKEVFFFVTSPGYEFPADGFGMRGKVLHPQPEAAVTLTLTRQNIAQRMYRVTGEGIYRDSVLLKHPVPLQNPVLNAGVLGSDSVLCTRFQKKLYWFWGDTQIARYPLGRFHATGATSPLPGDDGALLPSQGVDLTYFVDQEGIADNMAKMPGDGPTWLSGLTVLRDQAGTERMFAGYAKIKPPLEAYERGIVEFNTQTSRFEHRVTLPATAPLFPDGHPFPAQENGVDYIYFARPFPDVRVRATVQDFLDVSRYESFNCLRPGAAPTKSRIVRNAQGIPQYEWRRQAPARDWRVEAELLESGMLKPEEIPQQLKNADNGETVIAHSGSISWNPFRKRYVMIAIEWMGSSTLGEIWYAEAEDLRGPWGPARKIVTHKNVSFYNPLQHPELAEEGGRWIYFEGTYTHSFTDNKELTPRYEYNQIMYRLDLADPRLQ